VPELDADEVLGGAVRELAVRAAPAADAFAAGSLSLVITDEPEPVTWSLTPTALTTNRSTNRREGADEVGDGDPSPMPLRAVRGVVAPEAASIRAPFATMLRLLAGTLHLDDAVARSLATTTGDAALLRRVERYLPEVAPTGPAVDHPTSAS
jgi:hypothetical protein